MEVHTAILFLSLISLHQITSVTASRCRNIQNGLLGSLCSICNYDAYMDHFCAGLTDKSGLITISISSINGTRCCTGSDCRIGLVVLFFDTHNAQYVIQQSLVMRDTTQIVGCCQILCCAEINQRMKESGYTVQIYMYRCLYM